MISTRRKWFEQCLCLDDEATDDARDGNISVKEV